MKRTKKYINVVLTVLLACIILITMLSAFVRFSLTNKEAYINLLESTNTYSAVTDALHKKMSAVLGDEISEDLKKSIITEDDVRKEADVVLDCMINNIIYGQAAIPDISSYIYKERIAEALKSLTGYSDYINNRNDFTSSKIEGNHTIQPLNLTVNVNTIPDISYLNFENSKKSSDELFFEDLATKAEIEAQGRAMLKEKGITEEQARAKLAEKGISEEQAWQYLRDNGYLDEEIETDEKPERPTDTDINSNRESVSESETNINIQDNSQNIDSQSEYVDDSRISKKKIQNIVMSTILDKDLDFEEKMDKIYAELMNEAEVIINKEMNNFNFSKLINSNIFSFVVKITSILYKSFYINLVLLLIILMALGVINGFNVKKVINYISKSMLISGLVSVSIFGLIYLSKIYMHFSGIVNKSYFQTMFLASSEYFCRILFIGSAGVFIAGLIINIFILKNRLTRRYV